MSSILERVINVVVEGLGVDIEEARPEASFSEDLGADSLDIVELVMAFEKEFDVDITDQDAEKISTIQQAADFIASKLP